MLAIRRGERDVSGRIVESPYGPTRVFKEMHVGGDMCV